MLPLPAPSSVAFHVVYCFDEISTGLDSSATYDIVSAIGMMARVRQTTNLFSLLQPPPEVFNLFDRWVGGWVGGGHGECGRGNGRDYGLSYKEGGRVGGMWME